MHSDINVSGLNSVKSATGTTIVDLMICLSSTKHTAKLKKNVGILIDVHVKQICKGAWGDGRDMG